MCTVRNCDVYHLHSLCSRSKAVGIDNHTTGQGRISAPCSNLGCGQLCQAQPKFVPVEAYKVAAKGPGLPPTMFNKLLSAAAFAALLLAQGTISAPQVLSPRSHKPCTTTAVRPRGEICCIPPTFPDAQHLRHDFKGSDMYHCPRKFSHGSKLYKSPGGCVSQRRVYLNGNRSFLGVDHLHVKTVRQLTRGGGYVEHCGTPGVVGGRGGGIKKLCRKNSVWVIRA
ncbi:hypothetical protein C8J57DRAFT_1479076 [Mycena rebaudengoi]|nr:hypothetical protein C8J57DRAFT_1479076 [Mycena rebaudengoi]